MVENRRCLSAGVVVLVGLTMSGIAWAGDVGKADGFDARVFSGGGDAVVALGDSEMAGLRGAGVLDGFIANMLVATNGQNTISYTVDDGDTQTQTGTGSLSDSFSTGTTTGSVCVSGCGSSGGGSWSWSSGGTTSSTTYTGTTYSGSTSLSF